MYIFLVAYRARGNQSFRRQQIDLLIKNIEIYFNKNNVDYKIMICEQNDDEKFNRGKLLNIAFLESERIFDFPKKYFHMNADYLFDLSRRFPNQIAEFKTGVMDLYGLNYLPILGAACVFDPESYRTINGFPNDLLGWGGDDWAIYNRLKRKSIPIFYPQHLHNSGFIIECNDDKKVLDESNNGTNMELAKRDDINTNGLSSCVYVVHSNGEFHNEKNIYHYLIDLQ